MRLTTSTSRFVATAAGPVPRTLLLTSLTVGALVAAVTWAPRAAGQATVHRATVHRAAAAVAEAPAAAPMAAAPPAGRLTPRGCTEGTGTATCDLYAMAATRSLNGVDVPVWGFSTTGSAGTASAPGPVLVVNQGDQVTITLHNALDSGLQQNLSLALPGQRDVAHAGGAGDDRDGVPSGSSRDYTFTATRPGTYLYEAGHTADGSRQVAMGLAGALVVLPGNGTGYGTSGTAYDDDAVLVLSEIDPRLNANPLGFDMRSFHPAYRLINGKPFPGSDEIGTDQGRTVLLRYVNAGAETHAMGVLGTSQLEVAQDGHPAQYATRLTAESIDPGETVDTLVSMPTGPESKFAVYDTSQHLDNNGQSTNSPLQVAFGGMLTFLDTNPPPPSGDGVGPVASNISATPNPSDGLSPVTVTADLSDATTGGSQVSQAEFVVDDAVTTGPGFGVPMSGTFGTVDVSGVSGTIPAHPSSGSCAPNSAGVVPAALDCLDAGKHRIYVRGEDAAGNWGVIGSVVFNLPKTGPATTNGSVDTPANGTADVALSATGDDSDAGGTITAAEYFIDTVGANGSGTAITPNRVATVVAEDTAIPAARVAALTEGAHHVFVHSKDSLGLWGPPLDIPLNVDVTGPTVDALSVGPNPSNGLISDPSNPGYLMVSGRITDRDGHGATQNNVTDAEMWIDTVNKAPGTGLQMLPVSGKMGNNQEIVYGLIPLTQVKSMTNGDHTVFMRGKDDAGNWGSPQAAKLTVDKIAPVIGGLTVTPNPTNGAASVTAAATLTENGLLKGAEYWFGTTDPGVGKATATQPDTTSTPGQVKLTIPVSALPSPSTQTLNVRVVDQAGNWSTKQTATFSVSRPNRIFATNFETGDPAFSSATGNVLVTTAAKVITQYEPATTQGLQASVPGTTPRTSYVTDTSPTNEPTYHARFAFNRNNLNVGTATPTLFQALSPTNGAVFSLQYRVSGGSAQIRATLNGNTGTATTSWLSLQTGANTIQLDWNNGTTTTPGTLGLVLNGSAATPLSRANNSLRVETVQLGLVSGVANGNTGSAYFDSFSSGRASA